MEADISDILASVSRAHATHANIIASDPSSPLSGPATAQQDIQALTRAWVAERVAPELLPWPDTLMPRVSERIRLQIAAIEDLTARMDAGASFVLVVLQTELERVRFLVRSLLRARIAKISKNPYHALALAAHLAESKEANTQMRPLLSPQEHTYLQHHAALLTQHYTRTFLSSFPPRLQSLSDPSATSSAPSASGASAAPPPSGMTEGPDLDAAVFVRCLAPVLNVSCGFTGGGDAVRRLRDEIGDEQAELADGTAPDGFREGQGERVVRMRRGDVWVVRWRGVREAVTAGQVELI